MKKKNISYLMVLLIITISNITFFGLLNYFRQLASEEINDQTLKNPFYLAFFLLFILGQILLILKMEKKIGALAQSEVSELESLQKSVVKFPSLMLVYVFIYSIISPQILLLGFTPLKGIRLDLTLLSMSNLLLVGIPFYIYFIRGFEEYCSVIPFSTKYLSMKLSIRTLLVVILSLFSLTSLTYLSIKVSGMRLNLSEAEIRSILVTAAPLVAFGVILTSLCIYLLMSGINKRIYIGQEIMKELSMRDYSSQEVAVPSRDELGVMIHEVNLVRKDTGALIKDISLQSTKTLETKESLVAVAEESSTAMTQMSSNIQSVGNSITKLDDNINSVTQSMGRLNDFISSLTDSMDQQVGAQEESTAAIEEMSASIDNIALITENKIQASQELQNVSDKGEQVLKTTLEQISKIFESLDNIKSMTQLILSIASQTNLLAMNAAIEAAHAGEAGRGFSVVADEIRKLAETASENSKQINESIKEIVILVEGATESGQNTNKAFGEISQGIRETLESLGEISTGMAELKSGGKQILGAVEKIRDSSETLNKQSGEMKEETAVVNQSTAGLTQISSEARVAMDEMSLGANEVLQSTLSLNDHASELSESYLELQKKIDQFKVD